MQPALENLSKSELIDKVLQLSSANEELVEKVVHLDDKVVHLTGTNNELTQQTDALTQLVDSLNGKISWLDHQITQLKRLVYGPKSERHIARAEQSQSGSQQGILFEVDPIGEEEVTKTRVGAHERMKVKLKKPFRGRIPEQIRRIDHILEPEVDTTELKKIGEETTEVLQCIEPDFYVDRFIRPKYVDPTDQSKGVITADLPPQPIEKSIAGASVLASVTIEKFVDHLPLYRQIQRFKRAGISIAPSTMGDWISGTCQLLKPLYECLGWKVVNSHYVMADETPIRVLDKDKKGKTHRGYHWIYQSPIERLVLFDYRPGRGRDGPLAMLKNFRGYLQTDGYAVYDLFSKKEGITLVGCLAHARRYFEQAKETDPQRAEYVLELIGQIYAVEQQAREKKLDAEDRFELRREKSFDLFCQLGYWVRDNYDQVLPKSAIGKAIHYLLGRYNYISECFKDGHLEIDINQAENSIRPIALGRKNYLFAGSHQGARRASMLYSFMATCKINKINPHQWLKDVLTRIPTHPINRIEELLPGNWQPAG